MEGAIKSKHTIAKHHCNSLVTYDSLSECGNIQQLFHTIQSKLKRYEKGYVQSRRNEQAIVKLRYMSPYEYYSWKLVNDSLKASMGSYTGYLKTRYNFGQKVSLALTGAPYNNGDLWGLPILAIIIPKPIPEPTSEQTTPEHDS